MTRHRPDLIVPIRDRRQRKRYLTLKNAGYAAIAAVVLFVGISVFSEMRGNGPTTYGRLVAKEMPRVEQKPVEVVAEAPTVDQEQTHADPMLVHASARAQLLQAQIPTPEPVVVAVPARAAAAVATGATDVAIVGGPEGVKIVQRERRKPTLSGGFGRQQ